MKIRLICRAGYQISPDSWNVAIKTFDMAVPDSVVQSDNKNMDWLHNIIGVEVIEDECDIERESNETKDFLKKHEASLQREKQ